MTVSDRTMTETQRLSWPPGFADRSQVKRFFQDMPIIGINKRAHRHICAQLDSRCAACLRAWGDDPEVLRLLLVVAPLVREYMRWPSAHFMPDDPCDILFFDPTMELRSAEAMMSIGDALNLNDSVSEGLFKGFETMSFGELLGRLAQALRKGSG